MKSIRKHLVATLITSLAAFASSASAEQLTVYATLFASTANITAWEDNQPVSSGSVGLKNASDRTVAEGSLNGKGRVYLYTPELASGQEYTVVAESHKKDSL